MKNLVILLLALIMNSNIYSQSGWFYQASNTSAMISCIYLVDQNTGYFTSYNNFNSTSNGGENWDMIYNFTVSASTSKLYFLNATTGYRLSANVLSKTTNGGFNWTDITIPNYNFNKLYFINSNTGFLSGVTKFAKTINGGLSWITHDPTYLNGGIGDMYFYNAYTGYAIQSYPTGNNGIAKTTTGGEDWTFKYVDTIALYNVSKPFGRYIYACGKNRIFRSTNYGENWSVIHQTNYFPRKIEMVDSLTGYYIGAISEISISGIIYKTTNGGLNWELQFTSNLTSFTDISFANTINGNVVGSNGYILRTNSGGVVTSISNNENILRYKIEQNYPNPFNPTTNIIFAIPKSSNVKVTIFDIAGKELETLVNEQLQAGTYQTDWNASKYSSGVYFYRITAGSFSETKRMTLIK